jgi:hypothetical protein
MKLDPDAAAKLIASVAQTRAEGRTFFASSAILRWLKENGVKFDDLTAKARLRLRRTRPSIEEPEKPS